MKPLARTALASPPRMAATLEDDLLRVEARLATELASREERMRAIASHLVGAGGKRVRPTVVLLVFHAVAADGPMLRRDDAIEAAVALELIHSATLLHDDIIDGGETRRGRPSAFRTFGLADTLVAGDFLFSRAFALCARFEAEVIRWAADACVALTEGEIMQGRLRRSPTVSVAEYDEIIRRKTACLFQAGARIAAKVAGAPHAIIDEIARCGNAIGMAFQLIDDLLDVIGDSAQTGKPVGIDLRDGNPSLPIVLALPASAVLARIWRQPEPSDEEVAVGLAEIRASGALELVRDEAIAHTRAAAEALASLSDTPYRDFLEGLIGELRDRVF